MLSLFGTSRMAEQIRDCLLLACVGKYTNFSMGSAPGSGGAHRAQQPWAGVGDGIGGEAGVLLGRGWCCSSHGWTFPGEEKGLCLLPCSAGADVLVSRLDCWVPVMDLPCAWLS